MEPLDEVRVHTQEYRIRVLEDRVRELEEFVTEIQGGKKWVLTGLIGISGLVATVYYVVSIWRSYIHG